VPSPASGQASEAGPAVRKLFVIVPKPHRPLASLQLSSPGRKRVPPPIHFLFSDFIFEKIKSYKSVLSFRCLCKSVNFQAETLAILF